SEGRSGAPEGCLFVRTPICGASAAMSPPAPPELPPPDSGPTAANRPPPTSTNAAADDAMAIRIRWRAAARRDAACTSASPKLGGGTSPGASWNNRRRSRSSMSVHLRPQGGAQRGQPTRRLALDGALRTLQRLRRGRHVQPLEVAQ